MHESQVNAFQAQPRQRTPSSATAYSMESPASSIHSSTLTTVNTTPTSTTPKHCFAGNTTRLFPHSLVIGIFASNPTTSSSTSQPASSSETATMAGEEVSSSLGWALYRTTGTEAHMYSSGGYAGCFRGLFASAPPASAICFYRLDSFRPNLSPDVDPHRLLLSAIEQALSSPTRGSVQVPNGTEESWTSIEVPGEDTTGGSEAVSMGESLSMVLEALADEHLIQFEGEVGTAMEFVSSLDRYARRVSMVLRKLPGTSWAPLWPDPTQPSDKAAFEQSFA